MDKALKNIAVLEKQLKESNQQLAAVTAENDANKANLSELTEKFEALSAAKATQDTELEELVSTTPNPLTIESVPT